jgi:hypothetical protein
MRHTYLDFCAGSSLKSLFTRPSSSIRFKYSLMTLLLMPRWLASFSVPTWPPRSVMPSSVLYHAIRTLGCFSSAMDFSSSSIRCSIFRKRESSHFLRSSSFDILFDHSIGQPTAQLQDPAVNLSHPQFQPDSRILAHKSSTQILWLCVFKSVSSVSKHIYP